MVLYAVQLAYSTYHNTHSGAEANPVVSLIRSISTSQLSHDFYRIVQPSRGTNPIHCKNHETTITYMHAHHGLHHYQHDVKVD